MRHRIYQQLAARRDAILRRLADEVAPTLRVPEDWRGVVALTGTNSARPGFVRPDILRRVAEGARSPLPLTAHVERIRDLIKEHYGEHFDAVSFATCEAALWASLEALATPPAAGRGEPYRARYLGLHEAYIHHHLSYGRPFPPRYKDLLADRVGTTGELGVHGRRLGGLDVAIVPIAGASYAVHGIKPNVAALLTRADPTATVADAQRAVDWHGGQITAVVALGYETTGNGRGQKTDGATADLMVGLGRLARRYNLPFIVDKARGVPFLGNHPDRYGGDLVLFSMDKVAGALTSGLAIGREDAIIPLRRAMGVHGERGPGGGSAYGKGAFAAFDPGREALVSQVAALEWIRDHRTLIEDNATRLADLARDEFAPLAARFPDRILIETTADTGGVEINYTRTWDDGAVGIPIFGGDDGAAGSNLIAAGLGALGLQPPAGDEGNLTVTPERGLLDDDGVLIVERARLALRALDRVLEVLADEARRAAGG